MSVYPIQMKADGNLLLIFPRGIDFYVNIIFSFNPFSPGI